VIDAQTILAQLSDVANAGSFYGVVVELAAGGQWIFAEEFSERGTAGSIALFDKLSGFRYTPRFAFGGPDFGGGTIIQ
jgi:hypothetical protein